MSNIAEARMRERIAELEQENDELRTLHDYHQAEGARLLDQRDEARVEAARLRAELEQARGALADCIESASLAEQEGEPWIRENRRLRAALEQYACAGEPKKCHEVRLKDGSCAAEASGHCGKVAREALAAEEAGDG